MSRPPENVENTMRGRNREEALDAFIAAGCHRFERYAPTKLNTVLVINRAVAASPAENKNQLPLSCLFINFKIQGGQNVPDSQRLGNCGPQTQCRLE